MKRYYVRNDKAGGAIVEAATRTDAIAAVNFAGTAALTVARRAKPGDRSWSYGSLKAHEYTERDGFIYLKERKIRRLFLIPASVAVFSEA